MPVIFPIRLYRRYYPNPNPNYSITVSYYQQSATEVVEQRKGQLKPISNSMSFNPVPLAGTPLWIVNKLDDHTVHHRVKCLPFGLASSTSAFNSSLRSIFANILTTPS